MFQSSTKELNKYVGTFSSVVNSLQHPCPGLPPLERPSIEELASLYLTKNADRSVLCTLCGKISKEIWNAKDHLESQHFPSEYPCQYCDKICKSKINLANHMSQQHRGMK